MKTQILNILENTGKTLSVLHSATRDAGPMNHNNDWVLLAALTPPILAAFAMTEIGAWAISELGRQIRIHEKRPASPSLRGTPTPEEIAQDWAERPRTLGVCLRIGSRLADLDPTLDHTIQRTTLPNGKTVFRSRKGGMKGWLEDRRVPVAYSTVMRYKKLAQRLRIALKLDDRLPLEWVLSGVPSGQSLPSGLGAQRDAASRRLAELLRGNSTFKSLSLAVEKALGIVRLVAVRRGRNGHRNGSGKHGERQCFSVIPRRHAAGLSPERVEATKAAMGSLLGARGLSGKALGLQNRVRHWLTAVAREAGIPGGGGGARAGAGFGVARGGGAGVESARMAAEAAE